MPKRENSNYDNKSIHNQGFCPIPNVLQIRKLNAQAAWPRIRNAAA
jgi:hypothetical protein